MQRELVLETDRPLADALTAAFEAMISDARGQARRAVEAPAEAMHDYRRALRRAEAVLELAWSMSRKVPRRWLASSLGRARRRTRIARDLDAALPVVDRLAELGLLEATDPTLGAVRAWLEQCRAELASDEIVAWRLRKNARALAGLPEIFAAAIHAWVDVDIALGELRQSYRDARKRLARATASGANDDVHAFRRAVRRLRYQLELFASARPAEGGAAPAWLPAVTAMHAEVKALARELGQFTDLIALRAIVDEAGDQVEHADVGFDPERLAAILGELAEGRRDSALVDAARLFAPPPKRVLVPVEPPDAGVEVATHASASD